MFFFLQYESDKLASESDEKCLKKVREEAGCERHQKEQAGCDRAKKQRFGANADNQLFRSKALFFQCLVYFVIHHSLDLLAYPTIFLSVLLFTGI